MEVAIEIEIAEIALIGFGGIDRERVRAALVAELSRLLAEEGIPAGLSSAGTIETLDSGAFRLAPGMRPERIGQQIALALYRGIARTVFTTQP
ncbi:hypothetical protein [Chloroflexus sp.]|jgi:hypothetical protein|uniref:hypothetical protein n=1 Tax=Chloroflexus sp. TaxID=1904827 RepID=UPI00258AD219|nr:hypothetical protein [Chloroflexus sp.]